MPIDQVPTDVANQWSDVGATIVPPTGYLQQIDLKAEVINHSGGKVDDATARKWAEGLERAIEWDNWAVNNLQPQVLRKLGPQDGLTQQAVFGDDYTYVHQAQAANGQITGVAGNQIRMVLVPVPAPVKQTLTATFKYPSPVPDWAFIVTVTGPNTVILTKSDGSQQKLSDLPATFRQDEFVAGELRSYPETLGDLWYLHTYLSCPDNDFLRAACSG